MSQNCHCQPGWRGYWWKHRGVRPGLEPVENAGNYAGCQVGVQEEDDVEDNYGDNDHGEIS